MAPESWSIGHRAKTTLDRHDQLNKHLLDSKIPYNLQMKVFSKGSPTTICSKAKS